MRERIVYGMLAVSLFLAFPVCAQEASPTDDIVIKATNAVIFEMTANLKLTQDQISAIRPVVTDNIVKGRNLQQSLEDGTIDSKTMYNQREQLTYEEDQELTSILTPEQLKVWIMIQNQSESPDKRSSSK